MRCLWKGHHWVPKGSMWGAMVKDRKGDSLNKDLGYLQGVEGRDWDLGLGQSGHAWKSLETPAGRP